MPLIVNLSTIEQKDNDPIANVEKMGVALTPEMVAMMREVVETGEHASASEVMPEALRGRKHRRTLRARAVEELERYGMPRPHRPW